MQALEAFGFANLPCSLGKEEALESEIFEPVSILCQNSAKMSHSHSTLQLKVNLIQQINTINAFLPLIRKGTEKKLIYISSGHADIPIIRTCEIPIMMGYAVSKGAGNIVMAKYAAELKGEGIKTLAMSPGW